MKKKKILIMALIFAVSIVLLLLLVNHMEGSTYSIDDFKKRLENGIKTNNNNYVKIEQITKGKRDFIYEWYKTDSILYQHQEDPNFNCEIVLDFINNKKLFISHIGKSIYETTIEDEFDDNQIKITEANEEMLDALLDFNNIQIRFCGEKEINNQKCLKFCIRENKILGQKSYCYINSETNLIVKKEEPSIKRGKEYTYENKKITEEDLLKFDSKNYPDYIYRSY